MEGTDPLYSNYFSFSIFTSATFNSLLLVSPYKCLYECHGPYYAGQTAWYRVYFKIYFSLKLYDVLSLLHELVHGQSTIYRCTLVFHIKITIQIEPIKTPRRSVGMFAKNVATQLASGILLNQPAKASLLRAYTFIAKYVRAEKVCPYKIHEWQAVTHSVCLIL